MKNFKNSLALLTIVFLTGCVTTQSFSVKVDSVTQFTLLNYNDFSLSTNSENLSPEVNPLVLEAIESRLANELELRGLKSSEDSDLLFELSISAKDEIESNRFGSRSYYYDRRYFYLDDDIETEERFVLRLTIKDKTQDKSLWTGFTSWNQNRLNDSSDTEIIQTLVNNLLEEL